MAGGGVMMMLGPYMFSLKTAAYQTFKREANYRWPQQDRLMRAPAKQFVGQGEQTLNLEGVIYPEFAGGLGQMKLMRAMAGLGQPLLLIAAPTTLAGITFGHWTIENISESSSHFLPNGVARKVEFSLSLGLYGEDWRGFLPYI